MAGGQVDGSIPCTERQLGVFEDSTYCYCELLVAGFAGAFIAPVRDVNLIVLAERAGNFPVPSVLCQVVFTSLFVLKIIE